ncbi:MAG: hypothetical protein KBF42_05985 [Chitinophagales bacterium]|nr:hypothetical protein [Bacteroidota bacterium]MBP9220912.1 hypothetical protein [Chitinophagales bacterium]
MTATIISTVLLFGSDEATRHLPEGLYKALMGFHSGWRYIILILMVLGIWFGFQTSKGKRPFAGATKKMGMFTMISIDLQLVAGLLLYFNWISTQTNFKISNIASQMGVAIFRNIALDHAIGMLIAIIFIHIGYAKAKKALNDADAGRKQFIWFLIAFILILVSIPWPFLYETRGWV